MAIKVLINRNRFNQPAVTIQPKNNRLMLNKQAWEYLTKEGGADCQYVEILMDDAQSKQEIFYIKLCDPETLGSRKLDVSSPSTRTCNITDLVRALKLTITQTTSYKMEWDQSENAGRIDTANPLSGCERQVKNEKD